LTSGKRPKPFQPFPNYAAGTWGPSSADALLARDGRAWRNVFVPQPHVTQSVARVEPNGGAQRTDLPLAAGAKPAKPQTAVNLLPDP